MALPPFLDKVVGWLRAGYPTGVPEHDYIPLFAILGGIGTGLSWFVIVVQTPSIRYTGIAWLLVGFVFYVVYRRIQGKPLAKRYQVPAEALRDVPEVEYGAILVPIFGEELDDDIVGTAGRLAAEEAEVGEGGRRGRDRRVPAGVHRRRVASVKALSSSSGILYVCCSSGNAPLRTSSA